MKHAVRCSISDTEKLHRKPRYYEKKTVVKPVVLTRGNVKYQNYYYTKNNNYLNGNIGNLEIR